MRSSGGGSALIAGASIAAVELPTAVPYFAVIAGIVASSASLPQEIGLLTLYNVVVLPLLAIIVVLLVAGDRADPWLEKAGAWLQRRWPVVLASLLLLVGSVLAVLGGTGLVKQWRKSALRRRGRCSHLVEEPSPAELAVLRGLANGLSRRETGAQLYISLNTVKTHTRELYRKLDVTSRADAVARAEALGLFDPTESPG